MDSNDLYCSMIHSGLQLNFQHKFVTAAHCCIRKKPFPVDVKTNFWHDPKFQPLREINKQNVWGPGCENCESLEKVGQPSFRTGMNQGLSGEKYSVPGPKRIDLMFDIACNLGCRTCGPKSSTFWQKHLNDHATPGNEIKFAKYPYTSNDVISALSNLDLSDLQMVVFCGGETLLGQSYWNIVPWLADNVDVGKLTLCFQTNGTQPINPRNYDLISKFHLIKLHVSLDGINQRFDYLRWPASWTQVVDNLMEIRETAPTNVMFLVEETVSIFNLYYQSELENWIKQNYVTNREGDRIDHTKHIAHSTFRLDNLTQEYVDAMQNSPYKDLIPKTWKENPDDIAKMIEEIRKFDGFRNESFQQTFPEVAEFYRRYL